jgi:hypothetical protein
VLIDSYAKHEPQIVTHNTQFTIKRHKFNTQLTIERHEFALRVDEVVNDGVVYEVVFGVVCGFVEVYPAGH